jgi:hypothetical protein
MQRKLGVEAKRPANVRCVANDATLSCPFHVVSLPDGTG